MQSVTRVCLLKFRKKAEPHDNYDRLYNLDRKLFSEVDILKNNVINIANDLGYGFVKTSLNGERIKMPSVIASEQPQDIAKPEKLQQDAYMHDFLNHMDVSFFSSEITTKPGRYLIGEAAINSGLQFTAFLENTELMRSVMVNLCHSEIRDVRLLL